MGEGKEEGGENKSKGRKGWYGVNVLIKKMGKGRNQIGGGGGVMMKGEKKKCGAGH